MNLSSLLHKNPKHVSSRNQQDPFMRRITDDPYLDWLIMIIVFSIGVVVFIVLGYITYKEVQNRLQMRSNLTVKTNLIFDSGAMDKVLKKLDARDAERNTIIQESIRVSDPSL